MSLHQIAMRLGIFFIFFEFETRGGLVAAWFCFNSGHGPTGRGKTATVGEHKGGRSMQTARMCQPYRLVTRRDCGRRPPSRMILRDRPVHDCGTRDVVRRGNNGVFRHAVGRIGFGSFTPPDGEEKALMLRKRRAIGLAIACAAATAVSTVSFSRGTASADDAPLNVSPAIYRVADGDKTGPTVELVRHGFHGGHWGWGGGYRGFGGFGWGGYGGWRGGWGGYGGWRGGWGGYGFNRPFYRPFYRPYFYGGYPRFGYGFGYPGYGFGSPGFGYGYGYGYGPGIGMRMW